MTTIQWTDETWNPTTGCSRVSEGCRNCYIERTPPFRMAGRKLGDPVQLHPDRLDAPLHWKQPRRVFVNSLSDLFHEEVPFNFIDKVFGVMGSEEAGHHVFQVLTKRPKRMLEYTQRFTRQGVDCNQLFPQVWLGVSVEDQKTADERIPILLQVPAAVRFLSVEPLLGPVDLSTMGNATDLGEGQPWLHPLDGLVGDGHGDSCTVTKLDWVIVGGESGPKSRPCDLAWIRSIVQQCKSAKVPCFVKQLGDHVLDRNDAGFDGEMENDWPMDTDIDDPSNEWDWQGAKIRVRLSRKGGNPEEWPADLRVREWPR